MGFLKFLLAAVLVIIGAFGLLYVFFGTLFAGVISSLQHIEFSLIPSIIIGFVALVVFLLGMYLLRGR